MANTKVQEQKEANKPAALVKKENPFNSLDLAKLEIDMETMLKAGVHFGHQKARKHPKMDEYIFTTRNKINIIDLEATERMMKEALDFMKKVRKENKQILFVGTKKQAKDIVKKVAVYCDMPYVVERWLGGTFTNFKVIRTRAKYLKQSQEAMERGDFKKYTKFEQVKKAEELERLERKMGGLKNMAELPGAVFVADAKESLAALEEANQMGIPSIALCDTNTNPELVDYPIPANDDGVLALRLMLAFISKAILAK